MPVAELASAAASWCNPQSMHYVGVTRSTAVGPHDKTFVRMQVRRADMGQVPGGARAGPPSRTVQGVCTLRVRMRDGPGTSGLVLCVENSFFILSVTLSSKVKRLSD